MIPLPPEALQDAGAVFGRRGSGKSNALTCLFEHELDAGHRAVMIDPKGDRWGIRLTPEREPSRFTVPIFGGDHGDIVIAPDSGAEFGRLIAEHDLSCLIDLSRLSLAGKQQFMLGFSPTLLECNRAPLTLFLEEVDQFANQDQRYQPAMLVHHIANFATLGRQRGIVPWFASQRPAKVNATVRSQADTLVAMKVTVPLDREAYRDWFKGHGREAAARVEEEAGRLQPGEALVWVGATEFFDRVRFPMASTYDSGRTPKHGERIDAVALPPIDLGAIEAVLGRSAAVALVGGPARAIEDDPLFIEMEGERDDLRGEVEQLRAERDRYKAEAEEHDRRIEAAIRALGVKPIEEIADAIEDRCWAEGLKRAKGAGSEVEDNPRPTHAARGRYARQDRKIGSPATLKSDSPGPERMPRQAHAPAHLPAGARKMIDMLERIAPARVTWAALAAMVGNKPTGGSFNTARKAMRASGLIIEDGNDVRATRSPEGGMSRSEALALWKSVLNNQAARMIAALDDLVALTRAELAAGLGMVPRGGSFNTGVAQLLRNGVAVDRGGTLQLAVPLPGEAP